MPPQYFDKKKPFRCRVEAAFCVKKGANTEGVAHANQRCPLSQGLD
jgi:hypothetical protein